MMNGGLFVLSGKVLDYLGKEGKRMLEDEGVKKLGKDGEVAV